MLVDNVAVLGVESCLLEGLKGAFTAETVMHLDDGLVRKIAAENQESVTERIRTQEKLRILEDGLHTLNRYRRSQHNGKLKLLVQANAYLKPANELTVTDADINGRDQDAHETEDTFENPASSPNDEFVNDTKTAIGQESIRDDWNAENASSPSSKNPVSNVKSRKRSVKNRAAFFDDDRATVE